MSKATKERAPSPPILVTVGLSGAGKTTVARILERDFYATRVRRLVTRPLHREDNPDLVVSVPDFSSKAQDVVYGGWSGQRYCIRAEDVQACRQRGIAPILEIGEVQASLQVARSFPPRVLLVWVRRQLSRPEMRKLLVGRGMPSDDVNRRLGSLEDDLEDLVKDREHIDYVIENSGALNALRRSACKFAEDVRLRQRAT